MKRQQLVALKEMPINFPLVLWGGVDINPRYYAQEPLRYTQPPSVERDRREFEKTGEALKDGRPIVGICRGAQLLCIEHGGTLYQHSKPVRHNHPIQTKDQLFRSVTAGHHQVMCPSGDFKHEVIGWNPTPTEVWKKDDESIILHNCAEVVWWEETRCLAIQPHPEWANPGDPFVEWINKFMKQKGIDYVF